MANQNFRVKKGLEVGLGGTFLYADENGVGIVSSTPRVDLDVRGTANIDQLEVGPGIPLVGAGSTYFKVNGDSLIDGDLRVTGDLIFDDAALDDITVSGVASIGTLYVTGISTFNDFVDINDSVSVGGTVTATSIEASEISVDGGTGIGSDRIETEYVNITGFATAANLQVTGVSSFVGLGTFQDDLYVSEDLFVERNAVIPGIATVGILTATEMYADDLTVTGTLQAASGGQLLVQGDTVIDGVVTIGGNSITLDGRAGREYIEVGTGSGNILAGLNTITGERSYVSVDEGRFNNFITVAGVGSTSTFAGDVNIDGDLEIGGTLNLGGGTGIGSDSIETTFLTVTGIATIGFMTATNASVAGIITATHFNSLSDRRVKENIRKIESPLDKVCQLNGVQYNFVNSNKPSMGVIAQEVERVFPELIAGTFPKSVNYNGLVGLLIEAVKELKEENEIMKKHLENLNATDG